jgi:hypothetical protein
MNANMKKKKQKATKSEHPLLGFLRKTKNGKYADINQQSLCCSRTEILRQEDLTEDETYYYSNR